MNKGGKKRYVPFFFPPFADTPEFWHTLRLPPFLKGKWKKLDGE